MTHESKKKKTIEIRKYFELNYVLKTKYINVCTTDKALLRENLKPINVFKNFLKAEMNVLRRKFKNLEKIKS